jgi:hypothetical protein
LERAIVTIELLYSEPFSSKTHTRTVSTMAEIGTFADELLMGYQTAGDILPGIDLRHGNGASMSIALASFGWALIHTDADLDQHCTRCNDTAEGGRHDVRWEEPLSVPRDWFIPKPEAVMAVSQWMADGTLAPELQWSDQCV